MFALLMLFGFTGTASAQAPEVKIESFYFTGDTINDRTAEICGGVYPAPGAVTHVTVTVDPRSKNPGSYTVAANSAGRFCTVVISFTGTATAGVAGFANSALVKAKVSR
jgi:hypothetical protein